MTEENKDTTTVEAQAPAEEKTDAPAPETQNEQPQAETSAPAAEETKPEPQQDADPAAQVEAAMKELGIETEPDVDVGDKPDEEKESEEEEEEDEKPETPQKPKTEAEEEAEVLAGVRSARGKERLQKMLAERKEARSQLEQVQNYIRASGLDKEGFANMMAIARMVSSADSDMQMKGLKALDAVRAELYKQLGKEAPGVDLLDGYDDLKKKVENMEMSRDDALAIMRGREVMQRREAENQQRAAVAKEQSRLQEFGVTAINAFQARATDPYFTAKVEEIQKYFAKPGVIEQFVRTTSPERWTESLLWLYDHVLPPAGSAAPRAQAATPITTNRSRAVGNRVPQGLQDNEEGIMKLMESMGL